MSFCLYCSRHSFLMGIEINRLKQLLQSRNTQNEQKKRLWSGGTSVMSRDKQDPAFLVHFFHILLVPFTFFYFVAVLVVSGVIHELLAASQATKSVKQGRS